MGDTSLRIVGSVLGLNRFTLSELIHNAKVKPSAARSWLRRNKLDFIPLEGTSTTGVGRPPRVWQVTAEAERRYEERLSRFSPARLAAAVDGTDRPAITRLEALDEAESYLALVNGTTGSDDRASALAWAVKWTDIAARRAVAHREVGDEVVPELLHRIVRAQVDASTLQRERETQPEPIEMDHGELPARVMAIARQRIAELENLSLAEAIVPWTLDRPSIAGSQGLEAIGSVMALGLMTSIRATTDACRDFAQQVHALSSTTCMRGLGLLDQSLKLNWSEDARVMFVVICAGIEQHPGLFGDSRVTTWLDDSLGRAEDRPAVKGAYLRVRLQTPGAHRDEIFGRAGISGPRAAWTVADVHPDDDDDWPVEPLDSDGDPFMTAKRSLINQGVAYFQAISGTRDVPIPGRSEGARFRCDFITEDND